MSKWLLYIFLFALPFGTRKLLFQFTPGFHEYEAAFIYGADIILGGFLVFAFSHFLRERFGDKFQIPNIKYQINHKVQNSNPYTIVPERSRRVTAALFALLLLAAISIFFAPSKGLALYSFIRLLTAAGFAAAVAYVVRRGIVQLRHIFGILAASAVLQSLIAFAQFVRQGSEGLWFLGEPVLSAQAIGIAKFAAEGGKILRAYGTFPHPNVLGAFLVLGLSSLMYLWLLSTNSEFVANERIQKFPVFVNSYVIRYSLIGASFYVVLLGLALTFSRSAWLIAIISLSALLFYCFLHHELRRRAALLLFTLVASGYTLVAVLQPFIFSRAQILATEPSVAQRLDYNRLGLNLIAQHPFGVGLGNQVFYSVRNGLYETLGMTKAWQWEPVHNIYILIAAEIGVLGAMAFLLFLLLVIFNVKFLISNLGIGYFIRNCLAARDVPKGQKLGIRNFLSTASGTDVVISQIMLLSLLVFGMVDHFLWTLRPGQLMLWFAIGMLWGVGGDREPA